MADLVVDFQQAATFLGALAAADGNDQFVFQTFTDGKYEGDFDPLAQVRVGTLAQHGAWIQALNQQGAGVFLQVNPGAGRGKNKITAARVQFCDVDGTPIDKIIQEMAKPHIVVQSSAGKYHFYWLTQGIPLERFTENQVRLAARYGSDPAVKNVDRVMRLPGTWHLKNPENPALVTCAVDLTQGAYTEQGLLGHVPAVVPASTAVSTTQHSGPPPASDVFGLSSGGYQLPAQLPEGDRTRHLISYIGHLVGKGYRDEAYIRAEVKKVMLERLPEGQSPIPDGVMEVEIYGIIPKLIAKETGSVPSQGSGVPGAPLPAVQPAAGQHAAGIAPASMVVGEAEGTAETNLKGLETFLERYLFVEEGQKVVDLSAHKAACVYDFEEFKKSTASCKAGNKPQALNWLEHPLRLTARDIAYMPGAGKIFSRFGHDFFNKYEGSDLPDVTLDDSKVTPFLQHLEYLIPDKAICALVLDWLAHSVQQPAKRILWAPLIVSRPGVGKGLLYQILQELFGHHNCAMIGPDDLSEKKSGFNEWMSGTLLVCIDEMYTSQKWEAMERLKPLMTEPRLMINHKFGKKSQEEVFAKFIAFSNHITQAAALSPDDRRWLVIHAEADRRSPEYYTKLVQWIESDGPAHLLKWCQSRNIAHFNPGTPPPMTAAKLRMIHESAGIIDQIIRDAIDDKEGPFAADIVCADIVNRFVMRKLSLDRLSGSERNKIRTIITDKETHLATSEGRYRVQHGQMDRKIRLYCIRHGDKWVKSPAAEITDEYIKAMMISMGAKVPGTHLRVVDGDQK